MSNKASSVELNGHELVLAFRPAAGENGRTKYRCPTCGLQPKPLHIIEDRVDCCAHRRARRIARAAMLTSATTGA
jgi:hypothetical protein